MGSDGAVTSVSVRLPGPLYQASRDLARRRGISLNALLREGLAAALQADEEQRFYDSFTVLGGDAEGCEVEYALPAQQEVMLREQA